LRSPSALLVLCIVLCIVLPGCSLSLSLQLSLWRVALWLGSVAGPEKLQPLLDKNQEMFNAFVKAVEELAVLRNNLNKTEVSNL